MKYNLLLILLLLIVGCESLKFSLNGDAPVVLPEGEHDICDYYYIDVDRDAIVESKRYGCTRYIECQGATTLELKIPIITDNINAGILFYDKEKKVLSRYNFRQFRQGVIASIPVPTAAVFFRTTYYNSSYQQQGGFFGYRLTNNSSTIFRPYHEEPIYFSVPVEQNLSYYTEKLSSSRNIKETTSVLLLPRSYDPEGESVPIIMYCHGYSHYVYYNHWGSTDTFLQQKKHWAEMGYAVFDTNGARNNDRKSAFVSAGAPQFVEAMRASFEYIHDHYNVQDSIYVIGGSAGGPLALNYARFNDNVKCVALLSPWTDLYHCIWQQDCRDAFVEYYEFKNEREYEEERVLYFDPSKNLGSINFPIKLWISDEEKGSIIYSTSMSFMKRLREMGKPAEIEIKHGLSHSQLVSGAEMDIDKGVVDWFESLDY